MSDGSPQLTLLRGFDLRVDGAGVAVPMATQRVVAFLAVHGRPVLRPYVAASLWMDASEERAQASLRSAVWRLGQVDHSVIVSSNGTLGLHKSLAIDLRNSIAIAEGALSSPTWEPAASDITCLSADLLPDWLDDWVLIERERFRQLRMHALEVASARLTAMGRFGPAVQAGLAAVNAEPLRESAHRVLIGAYIAEGNIGEARREYETFRALLHNELSLDPSAAMEDLIRGLTVDDGVMVDT